MRGLGGWRVLRLRAVRSAQDDTGLVGGGWGALGFGGVVAAADGEGGYAVRGDEREGVEGSVVDEVGGAEDKAVLVAEAGLDGAEVGEDVVGGGVVVEHGAAGLRSELGEGGGAGVEAAVVGVRAEGVDGGVGALATVDCRFEIEEAGVVFAVGEEKDEVAAGAGIECAELKVAGGEDGVIEGGAADGVAMRWSVEGSDEGGWVAGPGLDDVRGAVEGGDKGLIRLLPE